MSMSGDDKSVAAKTGAQFCKNGHDVWIVGRTKGRTCRECNKEWLRHRRASKPNEMREAARASYRKHSKTRGDRRKKYREEKPDYWRARWIAKYGLTVAQYDLMFDLQNGVCGICAKPETRLDKRTGVCMRLCVDHHHATNTVRKLLCTRCNAILGLVGEDPELLKNMAAYLEQHPLDRDVAAAMVVHQRAFGRPHGACGGASSQRVAA